jgi:hypothetical protein
VRMCSLEELGLLFYDRDDVVRDYDNFAESKIVHKLHSNVFYEFAQLYF